MNLSDPSSWTSSLTDEEKLAGLKAIPDSSLLLLADILPTGVFAAVQAMNHPKVLPMVSGRPWPTTFFPEASIQGLTALTSEDKVLTFVVVGLGPVGMCTVIALLDLLERGGFSYRIIAIDLLESRRLKMKAIYDKIATQSTMSGEFSVLDADGAKEKVKSWPNGCCAVLEVFLPSFHPLNTLTQTRLSVTRVRFDSLMNLSGPLGPSSRLGSTALRLSLSLDGSCTTRTLRWTTADAQPRLCSHWRLIFLVCPLRLLVPDVP